MLVRCTDFAKNKIKSCSEQRNRPAKISSKFMNILKMLIFSMLLHKKGESSPDFLNQDSTILLYYAQLCSSDVKVLLLQR